MKGLSHYAVGELYALCVLRGKEIERLQRRIGSIRAGHARNNAQRIALMRELPPRIEELLHQVAALTQQRASQLRIIEEAEKMLGPVTEWAPKEEYGGQSTDKPRGEDGADSSPKLHRSPDEGITGWSGKG